MVFGRLGKWKWFAIFGLSRKDDVCKEKSCHSEGNLRDRLISLEDSWRMIWMPCLYPWDLSNDHSFSNGALPGKQMLNNHCALFHRFCVNPKAHRRDTPFHIFHHARKSELPVWSCKTDPGNLTWRPKMMVSKRNLLFKGVMFSFYIPSVKLIPIFNRKYIFNPGPF